MLQMLINFIFELVLTLINTVTAPFLNALFSLFPSLGTYFYYIFNFFTLALTYLTTVLRWLLFTPAMLTLLFDYFLIKYSIFIIIQAVKFTITLYDKLKP